MGICHGVQISVPGTTSEPPSETPRHELARLGRNASLQFAHLIALHTPVLLPSPVIGGLGRPDGANSSCNASALRRNIHWFEALAEAQRLIEAWRIDYNEHRPHMALANTALSEYFSRASSLSSTIGKKPPRANAGYGHQGQTFKPFQDNR